MDLVAAVKDYAKDHYSDGGWDYLVECWDDSDIARVVAEAGTVAEAVALAADAVGAIAEAEGEARAEAF